MHYFGYAVTTLVTLSEELRQPQSITCAYNCIRKHRKSKGDLSMKMATKREQAKMRTAM